MRIPSHLHLAKVALLLTCLLLAAPAAADDVVHVVDSSLEYGDDPSLGDEITYTIEVEHPAGTELDLTLPPDGSRWSEINRQIETTTSGDQSTTQATLRYAIFRPGPTTGPPAQLLLDAQPTGVEAPRKDLLVAAVTDEETTLGLPRSPWQLWSQHRTLTWYALGAVGFGLLAIGGALFLRRRRHAHARAFEPPPHVIALDALERLAENLPTAREQFKPFYFELSYVLRRYLGQRFDFPGAELTTTEMVSTLREVDPSEVSVDDVTRWLRACDRVKFAGYIPGARRAENDLERAMDFVESTIPRPEPESPDAPDAEESP